MRIDPPELVVDSQHVTLQARFRLARERTGYPDRVWFRFPRAAEPLVDRGVEPFIVVLSALASLFREPIEVDLPVSERLGAGLEAYWTIFSRWMPDRFTPATIHPGAWRPDAPPAPGTDHAAAAFSGGVDGFFTLRRHLAEMESRPSYRIRYAVFGHGFDIPLADSRSYEEAAAAYERALARCDVQLIRVASNAREVVDRALSWDWTHGSVIGGTGLVLAAAARRFYVASSKDYATLAPWGSHPLVDPLLSTDAVQIIHDGAAFTRFEKLRALHDWDLPRPVLRVCWENVDGIRNCGRCSKCRQTMFALAALGALEHFTTFPPITSPAHFAYGAGWETAHARRCARQAIAHAAAEGRGAIALAGRVGVAVSRVRRLAKRVGRRLNSWGFLSRPAGTA